jgi:competence protein ComEC
MKFTKLSLLFLTIITFLSVKAVFNRPDGKLHICFLNIGQGDAILIQGTGGQKILIDGGPDSSVLSELGKKMNFYDQTIDLVVLTHPDSDHISGLLDILKRYKVKQILTNGLGVKTPEYQEWNLRIKEKNIPVKLAKRGQIIDLGQDIKMDVLYPSYYLINRQVENTNNSSIVLRLYYKDISVLLTGDAEEEVGEEFLKDTIDIEAEIFKVSHHGSRNGLGNKDEVLDKIKPEIAIISVGKNRFGHPDKSILNLLEKNNIKGLRTDECGTIEIATDGESYQVLNSK